MTYAEEITRLRKQVGDIEKTVAAEWTADGTTTVLLLPMLTYPVLEESYTLRHNGSLLTETTDYTIDLESGRIDLVDTPTNGDTFLFQGMRVSLTDDTWLEIVNDTIRGMGDDFFKEETVTSYTTTANMLSLDVAASDFIQVYDVQYRTGTTTNYGIAHNWRFSADEQVLYFGDRDEFTITGQGMRVRGIRRYTLGDTTDDTLDVQDKYLTVLEYGAISRYWKYKIRELVESVAKITQETTRTPIQEIIMLIDRYDRWYAMEVAKLKPAKPARFIPVAVPGKPRP